MTLPSGDGFEKRGLMVEKKCRVVNQGPGDVLRGGEPDVWLAFNQVEPVHANEINRFLYSVSSIHDGPLDLRIVFPGLREKSGQIRGGHR